MNFCEKILLNRDNENSALVISDMSYSYKALINQSEYLGRIFGQFHIRNHVCAILSAKSIYLYQSMLACFFSKTIYMPVNISATLDRNKQLISIADPDFIYVGDCDTETALSLLSEIKNKTILVSVYSSYEIIKHHCIKNTVIYIGDVQLHEQSKVNNNIAYLFFTSGSTGIPKGVPISYDNLNAFLYSAQEYYQFDAFDHFIQLSDIAFDLSIHETLLAFTNAATLYVYLDNLELSVAHCMNRNKITQCILVPSSMPTVVAYCQQFNLVLSSLKTTIGCGEVFPISYAKLWEKIAPQSRIFNSYGPTETTVACSAHQYHPENNYGALFALPIGNPFSSVLFSISNLGELIISGEQVAKQYWSTCNNSDAFIFDSDIQLQSYITGDRVSFDQKWGYLFHGRRDDQWQVHGYRLEKAEVESALRTIYHSPDIYVLPKYNHNGLIDSLVAFSTEALDLSYYKSSLLKLLPQVAIPSEVICLSTIPRMPNGKINYQALSAKLDISLRFYVTQSEFSDPHEHAKLLNEFSDNIVDVKKQVNSLFFHYADEKIFSYQIDKNRYAELNLRYLDLIFNNIINKNAELMSKSRLIEERALGVCRDSALICCAVLRSRGIPARLRSGFVSYFIPGLFLDGFCLEYFDEVVGKWKRVDTRTTELQCDFHKLKIDFDLFDLPRDKFISAADAWKLCRLGKADPNRFGSRFHKGLVYVRNRLIQDLALCNKQETLIWDLWGGMFDEESANLDLYDTLADLLLNHSYDIAKLSAFYNTNPLLKVPDNVLMDNPFMPESVVQLRGAVCCT